MLLVHIKNHLKRNSLFLTHRNIHYNLARMGTLKEELDEFYLRQTGLAKGRLGSMNLSNPDKNIIFNQLEIPKRYYNKLKKEEILKPPAVSQLE